MVSPTDGGPQRVLRLLYVDVTTGGEGVNCYFFDVLLLRPGVVLLEMY